VIATGIHLMTSQAKIESNRRNSQLSCGPKTRNGKLRSSQNARKHGMRSDRSKRARENSLAFEERLRKWSARYSPDDDIEEFFLHDNVCISFELEQARNAHHERVRSQVENADDIEADEVEELGRRLFCDGKGPTQTYGCRDTMWKPVPSSREGQPVDPDDPARLVRNLQSTPAGCYLLLDVLTELRDRLEPGEIWLGPDRLKCIRILGLQPLDAVEDRRVADILAASNALYRAGRNFEELKSDTGESGLASYLKGVKARHHDLVGPDEPEKARAILIELVEENIARVEAILEAHDENAAEEADRTIARRSVDLSRDGDRIWRRLMRCRVELRRGVATYRREKEKGGFGEEGGGGSQVAREWTGERPRARQESPALNADPAGETLSVPATAYAGPAAHMLAASHAAEDTGSTPATLGGADGADGAGREAGKRGWESVDIESSDVLACQGFLPERVMAVVCDGALLETDESGSGVDCREQPESLTGTASATPRATGTGSATTRAEECADATNEAKLGDHVIASEIEDHVELTPNSGTDSGLDNVQTNPNAGAGENANEIRNSRLEEGVACRGTLTSSLESSMDVRSSLPP
jgi:hypothetical protein